MATFSPTLLSNYPLGLIAQRKTGKYLYLVSMPRGGQVGFELRFRRGDELLLTVFTNASKVFIRRDFRGAYLMRDVKRSVSPVVRAIDDIRIDLKLGFTDKQSTHSGAFPRYEIAVGAEFIGIGETLPRFIGDDVTLDYTTFCDARVLMLQLGQIAENKDKLRIVAGYSPRTKRQLVKVGNINAYQRRYSTAPDPTPFPGLAVSAYWSEPDGGLRKDLGDVWFTLGDLAFKQFGRQLKVTPGPGTGDIVVPAAAVVAAIPHQPSTPLPSNGSAAEQERRARRAEHQRIRRAALTDEQRAALQAADTLHHQATRATMTDEQRAAHNAARRQTYRGWLDQSLSGRPAHASSPQPLPEPSLPEPPDSPTPPASPAPSQADPPQSPTPPASPEPGEHGMDVADPAADDSHEAIPTPDNSQPVSLEDYGALLARSVTQSLHQLGGQPAIRGSPSRAAGAPQPPRSPPFEQTDGTEPMDTTPSAVAREVEPSNPVVELESSPGQEEMANLQRKADQLEVALSRTTASNNDLRKTNEALCATAAELRGEIHRRGRVIELEQNGRHVLQASKVSLEEAVKKLQAEVEALRSAADGGRDLYNEYNNKQRKERELEVTRHKQLEARLRQERDTAESALADAVKKLEAAIAGQAKDGEPAAAPGGSDSAQAERVRELEMQLESARLENAAIRTESAERLPRCGAAEARCAQLLQEIARTKVIHAENRAAFASLETRLKKANSDALQATYTFERSTASYQERIATVEQSNEHLRKMLADAQSKLEEMRARDGVDSRAQINAQANRIENLEKKLEEANTTHKATVEQLASQTARAEELASQLQAAESSAKDSGEQPAAEDAFDLATKESLLGQIEDQLTLINAFRTKADEDSKRVELALLGYEALQTRYSELEKDSNTAAERVADLTSAKLALEEQVASGERARKTIESRIAEINLAWDRLAATQRETDAKVLEMTEREDASSQRVAELEGQLKAKGEELKKQAEVVVTLSTEVQTHREAAQKLQRELNQLSRQRSDEQPSQESGEEQPADPSSEEQPADPSSEEQPTEDGIEHGVLPKSDKRAPKRAREEGVSEEYGLDQPDAKRQRTPAEVFLADICIGVYRFALAQSK